MTPEEKKAYMKEYNKRYRELNKEKLRQQDKERNEARKEYLAEWYKGYYQNNKQMIEARKREWENNNKDKVSAGQKRHRLKLNLSNRNITSRSLIAWGVQVKDKMSSCQYCGREDNLQAHHILSKSKHPEFALLLNNGITLCWDCHVEEHKINGDI